MLEDRRHWAFTREWYMFWRRFTLHVLHAARAERLRPVRVVHHVPYDTRPARKSPRIASRWTIYPEQQLGVATLSRGV